MFRVLILLHLRHLGRDRPAGLSHWRRRPGVSLVRANEREGGAAGGGRAHQQLSTDLSLTEPTELSGSVEL